MTDNFINRQNNTGYRYKNFTLYFTVLLEACKAMTSPDPVVIGEYRGLEMELSFDTFSKEFHISLNGSVSHNTALGTDIFGNIQRLDNTLAALPDRLKSFEEQL